MDNGQLKKAATQNRIWIYSIRMTGTYVSSKSNPIVENKRLRLVLGNITFRVIFDGDPV